MKHKTDSIIISNNPEERAKIIEETPSGNYAGITEDGLMCIVSISQGFTMIVKVNSATGYTVTHYGNNGEAISFDKKSNRGF